MSQNHTTRSATAPDGALRIAAADYADAPLVHRIAAAAFEEYRGRLDPPSGVHRETVDDVRRALSSGGAVLARCGAVPVASARWELHAGSLYVSRVAVLPAYRGRGIASAIMRHMAEVARAHRRPRLRVGVRQSLPQNVALYTRLGFRVVSLEPHAGGSDTVLWMEQDVTA